MKKLIDELKALLADARAWLAVKIYPGINTLYTQGLINGYSNGRVDERSYVVDTIESVINNEETKKKFLPGLELVYETLNDEREKMHAAK